MICATDCGWMEDVGETVVPDAELFVEAFPVVEEFTLADAETKGRDIVWDIVTGGDEVYEFHYEPD